MRRIAPGILLFALAAGCGNNTPVNMTMDMAMAPGDMATKPADLAGPQPDMTLLFPVPAGCVTTTQVTGTAAYAVLNTAGCMGGTCHNSGTAPTFNSQTTFMTAMRNVAGPAGSATFKYVLPNDPNRSYLLYKLGNLQTMVPGGGGSQMPQGKTPLTAVQMCTIYDWILNGAPIN